MLSRESIGLPPHSLLPVLNMGTGINTGLAIVGYMGSETHLLNYTAFGRRSEPCQPGLRASQGHGRILIGEATYVALKQTGRSPTRRTLPGVAAEDGEGISSRRETLRSPALANRRKRPPPPEENTGCAPCQTVRRLAARSKT